MYETKISDSKWIVYDISGNIGWIAWFVCTGIYISKGLNLFLILALIPAILMLIGIIELISERIAKLDRILPRIRVLRGFGALTLGGILGIPVSIAGFFITKSILLPVIMLIGAILCGVFAGLLFAGYKKHESI